MITRILVSSDGSLVRLAAWRCAATYQTQSMAGMDESAASPSPWPGQMRSLIILSGCT